MPAIALVFAVLSQILKSSMQSAYFWPQACCTFEYPNMQAAIFWIDLSRDEVSSHLRGVVPGGDTNNVFSGNILWVFWSEARWRKGSRCAHLHNHRCSSGWALRTLVKMQERPNLPLRSPPFLESLEIAPDVRNKLLPCPDSIPSALTIASWSSFPFCSNKAGSPWPFSAHQLVVDN